MKSENARFGQRKISQRVKLTLLNIALVGILLGGMGWGLRARFHGSLISEIDRQLVSDTSTINLSHVTNVETNHGLGPKLSEIQKLAMNAGGVPRHPVISPHSSLVEVLRQDTTQIKLEVASALPKIFPVGEGFERIPGMTPEDPSGLASCKTGGSIFHEFIEQGKPMRSFSLPIRSNGKVVAFAQAVRPLGPVQAQMRDLDRTLLAMIPIGIAVAAFGGTLLIGLTMRPLRHLILSARNLRPDFSGERLPEQGHDEFAELAAAFNEAFDRSASAFERQREAIAQLERFTGDAGHELRTPLGSVKAASGFLLHQSDLPPESMKSVQILDRSADRMARLIDDLLLLARRDGGQPLTMTAGLRLIDLIDEVLEDLSVPPGIEFCPQFDPAFTLRGNPEAVRRVFTNVLANAFAYAKTKVMLFAAREEGFDLISISDDGEGIASADLSKLGQRFYRPDTSRSRELGGTGLGLAITMSLCEAHGGSIAFESVEGFGTTVRARFAR